jgi:L-2-amino-thiazoline-4-carboxylic acid hydrolase
MIKTSVEKPAGFTTFSRAWLAYGILREYITRPAWFMLETLLTLSRFKRRLPFDVSKDFAETVALEAWMYIRLKERYGQERAFALMRAVIIPVAMVWYGAGFRLVEAPRTYDNIIRFHELVHEKMLTEDGNLKIDERSDSRYTYRNFFCPWHDLFRKLGIPELTEPYCAIDNGLYNTYLPGEIVFHRGGVNRTIASGAPFCQYIYEHRQ